MKRLTLRLEQTAHTVQLKRSALETEITETQAAQIELDKTAGEYHKLHTERQQLIRQWDEAKQTMQKRDVSIAQAGEKLLQLMVLFFHTSIESLLLCYYRITIIVLRVCV